MDYDELKKRMKLVTKQQVQAKNADIHSHIQSYLPENAVIVQHAKGYYRLNNMYGHYLADNNGTIPLHRYVCYVTSASNSHEKCYHCGYSVPWKSSLRPANVHVVNVDHLDNDNSNNKPSNLVFSCWWCNANRSWAEEHPQFWAFMRKVFAEVPPQYRPDIRPFLTLQNLQPNP